MGGDQSPVTMPFKKDLRAFDVHVRELNTRNRDTDEVSQKWQAEAEDAAPARGDTPAEALRELARALEADTDQHNVNTEYLSEVHEERTEGGAL